MTEAQTFADDSPRRDPWTEDDFGYRRFAQRLADVIVKLAAPNGYVIGLHGVWGSGKTSALNFVAHFVRAAAPRPAAKEGIEIVWFEPWMISGQQDLINAFFRVLAHGIRDGKEVAEKRRRWFGKAAKTAVDPLVKASVAVAAAAHPPDKVAIEAGGEVAKAAINQTIDAWLGQPTLQEAHAELAQRLRVSGRRFLVIIDDIDRLERSEIRDMMQMVKSVGRLPNVVYLLAYDRRIVWRALDEKDQQRDGEPTFSEKIFQHELELPHVSSSALLRRLDRETKFVLERVEGSGRWRDIVQYGIRRWITIPRDIIRFANALRFSWPTLRDELDPADLLAMEGLRLFDPGAFDWIRKNRDLLFGTTVYRTDEEKVALVDAFRESLPQHDRDDVLSLLAVIFPAFAEMLTGKRHFGTGEIFADIATRRGMASPKGYDAYFAQDPLDTVVSKAAIDEMLASADDEAVVGTALDKALAASDGDGRPLIGDFLDELLNRTVGRRTMRSTPAMLRALVERGERIQQIERDGMSLFPPHIQLQILIRSILDDLGEETGGDALLAAVNATTSASMVASVYVWRAREADILPREGEEKGPIISTETLDAIGARALNLIRSAAADGTLADAPFYWDIMLTWTTLDAPELGREWLAEAGEGCAKALARVAKGLLGYSTSDAGTKVYSFRGISTDREFYDLDRLLAAADRFATSPDLDEDERARVVALRDGLRRRSFGEQ